MSCVYYNENDPKAAEWLRELILEGQIAWGDVDERSIEDVKPSELVGYAQCHFFAGIGGWSYALRLAGWPDDKPVWTGSCPCQPFSQAGKGKGTKDERHLWPAWFDLIRECRPAVIFGEQVASPAALAWWDVVSANLESTRYACAVADLCAAGVRAPHIRQRLYWVAHHHHLGCVEHPERDSEPNARCEEGARGSDSGRRGELGDASRSGRNAGEVLRTEGGAGRGMRRQPDEFESAGATVLAHAAGKRLEIISLEQTRREREAAERSGTPWDPCVWIPCRDGKSRPVEPGSFPLAHGVPGRVGLLRGYGNAIVAPLAAAFIQASGLV